MGEKREVRLIGFARAHGKGLIKAYSAGTDPDGYVQPFAARVMDEIGIDINPQFSKKIDPELLKEMDVIITLCDKARESCPVLPGKINRLHLPVEDPSKVRGSEEEILNAFRKTRDEIGEKIDRILFQIFAF